MFKGNYGQELGRLQFAYSVLYVVRRAGIDG